MNWPFRQPVLAPTEGHKRKKEKEWDLTINHVSSFFFTLRMKSKSLSVTQKAFHDFTSFQAPESFHNLSSHVFSIPARLACGVSQSTSPFTAWCPWTQHILLQSLFADFFFTWKISPLLESLISGLSPSDTPHLSEVLFPQSPSDVCVCVHIYRLFYSSVSFPTFWKRLYLSSQHSQYTLDYQSHHRCSVKEYISQLFHCFVQVRNNLLCLAPFYSGSG